jgi:hypothetical protein
VNLSARLSLLYVLVPGALLCGLPAIVLPVDLGQGLAYFRVHELPTDLPSPTSGRPGACVLDLRFAKADELAASALNAWVKFNASAHTPIFILENAETSPALLASFPGSGPTGVLVVAPVSDKVAPDFAVQVPAAVDRRAYDAVENGVPIGSLLHDNPDKPRIDEAYLEKEHLADSEAPDIESDKPSPPSPLVDAVLQRAVQLHEGLLALKRL